MTLDIGQRTAHGRMIHHELRRSSVQIAGDRGRFQIELVAGRSPEIRFQILIHGGIGQRHGVASASPMNLKGIHIYVVQAQCGITATAIFKIDIKRREAARGRRGGLGFGVRVGCAASRCSGSDVDRIASTAEIHGD